MKPVCFMVTALLLLQACAHEPPFVAGPHLRLAETGELPPPDGAEDGAFRIGALDRLLVSVIGIEELTQKVQVDASGKIALPMVGTIQAGGRTPEQLSAEIEQRLRQAFVRNPRVAVNLDETNSQQVTVDGSVLQPGIYPVVANMTLQRAIASAKGATEFAKLEDVVVFRTVKGQKMAALYNLGAIRRGNYEDPTIYPDDVIVVGDSPARRRFRDLLAAAPLISTPVVAFFSSGAVR